MSMNDLLKMDIDNTSGQKRQYPSSFYDAQVEPLHPAERYVDLPNPNTMRYSADLDPSLMKPTRGYAFRGPLNLSDSMYSRPRGGRVPYSEWLAGARSKGRVASYPRKRSYAKRKYTPKYGKKGSRFYYSRYNPKSYYVRGSRANVKRFGSTFRKGTKTQQLARKRVGYYGRGKYGVFGELAKYWYNPDRVDKVGKAAGAAAEVFADTPFAAPLEFASGALGAASGYMGRGMYTGMKRGNQLISGGVSNTPVMRTSGYDGSLMVSHRELIQEVYGAGTVGATTPSGFEVTTLTVNPGLERVFPWLSQLAANFEEYEIHQCVFEYEGRKMVGTTDELTIHGTVTAAHKFNFKAQEFQDKHEMQSYPHANQTQAHQSLAHGVEADPGKIVGDGHKFVRLGGLLATDDQRDYDHCTFSLAQSNIPAELAAKEIGCLYVAYTVKLMKPKLHANRGLAIKTFRAVCSPGARGPTGILGTSYDTKADGTTSVLAPFAKNTLDMSVIRKNFGLGDVNAFVFPPNASGVYKVNIVAEADNTVFQGTDAFNTSILTDVISIEGQISGVPALAASGAVANAALSEVSMTIVGTSYDGFNSKRAHLEFLIKVKPQVGNQINAFGIRSFANSVGNSSGPSGEILQSRIDITEYNTFGEDVPTIGR